MIKTYKNIKTQIKKIAYISAFSALIIAAWGISVFSQEGTIEEKVNGEISTLTNISYALTEEQKSLEEISNEINQNVQEERKNAFEIGQWQGYKKTIKGVDHYFIDGLDYTFLKYEIKSDIPPTFAASANYAISQGLEGVVSAITYKKNEILFYRESREQKKDEEGKVEKGIYTVYVKTNIKNTS